MGTEAWGHSVADLLEELAASFEVHPEMRDRALELDKAYIPTRYPNAHPSGYPQERYTQSEAERCIDHAANILEFCQGLLPKI